MTHISIIVPEGNSSLSNLEATHKMFNMANDFLMRRGKERLFKTQLVPTYKDARLSNGIFTIIPDATIAEVKKTDFVIIPAIHGDYSKVVEANKDFIPWIVEQYKNGAEVASLCIGAFLLASTGL